MKIEILLVARLPGLKEWMVSPAGIAALIRLGVTNKAGLTKEVISAYQSPFATAETRQVLHKTLTDLRPRNLKEVAAGLPKLDIPIRIIYGHKDFVLPAVASDLHRLKAERPDIPLTALPHCGHFLQEGQAESLSTLLLDFLREQS